MLGAALAGGCRRDRAPQPAAPGAAARPSGAAAVPDRADAIVYRFQDHLAEAEVSGPDPGRALAALGPRVRALVNPHGRAPRRLAPYLCELAFDRGRVAAYAREEEWPGDGPDHRGTPRAPAAAPRAAARA